MPITNSYLATWNEGDTDTGAVDFTDLLDSGELVASATVTEVSTADLTIGSVAVNAAAIVVNDATVAIGKAVQWSASGPQAGTTYTFKVTATTDSTPARVLVRHFQAVCV